MHAFLYTLILLGSIQGVIICCLLLSKNRLLSNRLLAGIIALLSLPGFHLYFHYNGLYDYNTFSQTVHDLVPMVIIMPLGPLVYLYVLSLVQPGRVITPQTKLHFLPVVIDLLPKIAALVFYIAGWVQHPLGTRTDFIALDNLYNKYADIPRWISITVYIIFSIRFLQKHSFTHTSAGEKTRQWIRTFTTLFLTFQIIWFFYLIPYILPSSSDVLLKTVDWFPLYIPMTILVYWVGIQGYLYSYKLPQPKKNIDTTWVDDGWQQLLQSMENDQLYLDPTLNLEKLAAHTGLSARQISALLNQHQSINFNAFINQYRVDALKRRLTAPDAGQFTLAALALQCGFNSSATFQRIFKQYTGMAPSAFVKLQKHPAPSTG